VGYYFKHNNLVFRYRPASSFSQLTKATYIFPEILLSAGLSLVSGTGRIDLGHLEIAQDKQMDSFVSGSDILVSC
jgi:hypothetical protein